MNQDYVAGSIPVGKQNFLQHFYDTFILFVYIQNKP